MMPTAMHLEPWAFVIVQNRQLLARISDRAKALIATYSDEHRALPRTGDGRLPAIFSDPAFDIFYAAPALIAICGKPMGVVVTSEARRRQRQGPSCRACSRIRTTSSSPT